MTKPKLPFMMLPNIWQELTIPEIVLLHMPEHLHDTKAYIHRVSGMQIMIGMELHSDNMNWLHLSCSHPDRLPTWYELKHAKEDFIGKDKRAFQILPPEKEYVNTHPNCLHLWHCPDKDYFKEGEFDYALD